MPRSRIPELPELIAEFDGFHKLVLEKFHALQKAIRVAAYEVERARTQQAATDHERFAAHNGLLAQIEKRDGTYATKAAVDAIEDKLSLRVDGLKTHIDGMLAKTEQGKWIIGFAISLGGLLISISYLVGKLLHL